MRDSAAQYELTGSSENASERMSNKSVNYMPLAYRKLVKYAFIGICTVSLLFAIYTYRSHATGRQFASVSSSQPSTSNVPLLGSEENVAALWFPSIGASFMPQVASYNLRDEPARIRTPLFIGFTRNHQLLEQTVLSYIAAGWPREDIIVVDNSGTMDANSQGLLSKDNPFFLDYQLYRSVYGVSILQTPTLLSFAQLMNFYLRTAIAQRWLFFFWSHMDVAVLSDETATPYKSFHTQVTELLTSLGYGGGSVRNDWAVKFFAYDWLTLVNVDAWRTIGAWDTFIPYYAGDCDYYSRIAMHGYSKDDAKAGHIYDVSSVLSDPKAKLFPSSPDEQLNSKRFQEVKDELDALMKDKWREKDVLRNSWQDSSRGGEGEPWTYNPRAFQHMWWHTAEDGKTLYAKKWGTMECRLEDHGITLKDEFKQELAGGA